MRREKCRGCGVLEGAYHQFGCFHEHCPFCTGQLQGCGCLEERVDTPSCPEDADTYPESIALEWQAMLTKKGRVPFIYYPNLCAKCGAVDPKLFRVPDREWTKYVEVRERRSVLCRPCFDFIKSAIIRAQTGRRSARAKIGPRRPDERRP